MRPGPRFPLDFGACLNRFLPTNQLRCLAVGHDLPLAGRALAGATPRPENVLAMPSLLAVLEQHVAAAGLTVPALVECGAAPTIGWMTTAGVGIDVDRWRMVSTASTGAPSPVPQWVRDVGPDGRVYPTWCPDATVTGRLTSRAPNVQGIPRGPLRSCVAAAPGHVLVKADYSQNELRLAARASEDAGLIRAFQAGADLHVLTARLLSGAAEVTPFQRQMAKPINFGLVNGMGAEALATYARSAYGVDLSLADAAAIAGPARAYPRLAGWQRAWMDHRVGETRTLLRRRRLYGPEDPATARPSSILQGSAADGLKGALALLWLRRVEAMGARPVIASHDEIVVEAPIGLADVAAGWLQRCMSDAMRPILDPVPVGVEVTVGPTWS